jgi:hypothetical protein
MGHLSNPYGSWEEFRKSIEPELKAARAGGLSEDDQRCYMNKKPILGQRRKVRAFRRVKKKVESGPETA